MTSTRSFPLNLVKEETERATLDAIISHFQDERDEEIGIIAAEAILDVVLDSCGKDIYNQGLSDAQKIVQNKQADLNLELEALRKEP